MEAQTLERLEEMVACVRSASPSKYIRWPAEVRRAVNELIGSGVSFREISKRTGIANESLRQWTGRSKPRGKGFKQMKVISEASLLVRLASGAEVRHLSWAQLKELILERVI